MSGANPLPDPPSGHGIPFALNRPRVGFLQGTVDMRRSADASTDQAVPAIHGTQLTQLRYTRPSLLDPWLASEPGLGACHCMPNVAVLYLLNRPIAVIQATPMDQASLDSTLARMRNRLPR